MALIFLASLLRPVLAIGKMIYTAIMKHVKYHRGLDKSMIILQRKLNELDIRKTDIESEIGDGILSAKIPKKELESWLVEVKEFNNECKELEKEVAKGKFLLRARLGSRAAAKIREVEALHQKGYFSNVLLVNAVPSRGGMFPTTTLVGEATSKKVEEIWNSLISDNIIKFGVWGMGGIGKTTIMKIIRNCVFEQIDRFDNVYWITVSKEANVRKLQEGMASALKLEGDFKEAKEDVVRATILSARLKKEKRYVLIFDDVWEAFKLEDVGIPEPTIGDGCKLILTTRSLDVCRRMDCMPTKMELLSKDEAWNLFLDKVGCDHSMSPDLQAIAKQVAEECACLPLAIVTIGTSMKGVVDKREWRTALRKLRECAKGFEGMSKVIEQLKYSYTQLNDEQAQRCLLYCALYPEDWEIERHELILYLIAEEIIEGMESRKDAFDEGHTILNKLENACLLESWSGLTCVKMHDVIRDMALQIRDSGSMVECGLQVEEFPKEEKWTDNLETVSLMGTDIKEIPVHASPKCSKLKTLRLSKNKMLRRISDSFFVHMPSLCILDLSRTNIENLPNSLSELENLTALVLRGSRVRYVPSLAKLQRLRVLDLHRINGIIQVPEGMEMLVNLQYLNIDGISKFPTGILPKLIRLQFFSAFFSKIKVEELMGLKKLETLGCKLSVNDFNSYINSLPTHHRSLPNCVLHVGILISDIQLDESMNFKSLRVFLFKEEDEEERESSIVVLRNNVKEVLIDDWKEVDSRLPFVQSDLWFKVEVLQFKWLLKLRVLVDIDRSQLQQMSRGNGTNFSCLRELHVKECYKLEHLFKLELVPYFPNLESINVSYCYEMVELVAVEEDEESDDLSIVIDALTITFPKLRSLNLYHLPELKSVIGRKGMMVCDSIEEIYIEDCPKVKRLPLYLPPLHHNGQPSPPAALKVIKVRRQEWWDSLEWDNPIAKDVLQPFVKY